MYILEKDEQGGPGGHACNQHDQQADSLRLLSLRTHLERRIVIERERHQGGKEPGGDVDIGQRLLQECFELAPARIPRVARYKYCSPLELVDKRVKSGTGMVR